MSRSYIPAALVTLTAAIALLCPTNVVAQDLADVIEKCERSVVRIEVKGKAGDSIGSGFIVEGEGVICTNVHVLAGAQEATATFANGKSYRITGTYYYDESRDICIAQLDSDDFPKVVVSRVPPRKGETVTALGAPRGLSFTATNGIVSAIRSGKQLGEERNGTWIQIDAALSPGNSGGPLINSKGRVIAMSTLASTGRSQNLNFGISAKDIREAIDESQDYELLPLKEGVGELELDEAPNGGDAMIDRPSVSDQTILNYVEDCRADYKKLSKKLIRQAVEADKVFRLMRRGDVPIPQRNYDGDYMILVNSRTKKEKYYFRSDRVKDRKVRQAEQKAERLKEIKSALTKEPSNESIMELVKHTGLYLDPFDKGSIGVMLDGVVVHPFNDHDVIIDFEGKPYLLWMPSTSGLARLSELPPTTVYVAGTQTVLIPGGSTMSVTILVALKDSELKKAVFGDKQDAARKGSGDMRTWTAGRFKVEAKVVKVDGKYVVLEKLDGKSVTVAISKLSDDDRKYLKER